MMRGEPDHGSFDLLDLVESSILSVVINGDYDFFVVGESPVSVVSCKHSGPVKSS